MAHSHAIKTAYIKNVSRFLHGTASVANNVNWKKRKENERNEHDKMDIARIEGDRNCKFT